MYYNYPETEGTPQLDIKASNVGRGLIEITLTHDKQQDDSQEATKIVMIAELIGRSWMVNKIKKNIRCYKGRGHTEWGIERCK